MTNPLDDVKARVEALRADVAQWKEEADWASHSKNPEIARASLVYRSAQNRKEDELSAWSALQSVLEIHESTKDVYGDSVCTECSDQESGTYVMYPCPTVVAIAKELGVE